MKKHLNTLFVTTQGAYLSRDGQAVAVIVEKETKLRLPLLNLDGIVCMGRVSCSPALMAVCAESGVAITFLSLYGRFQAAVQGYTPGNVLLRRRQYRVSDDPQGCLEIARSVVIGKLINCRQVLLRGARDAGEQRKEEALQGIARRLAANLEDVKTVDSLDRLRGLEGEAATSYFQGFNSLLTGDASEFRFTRRSRRPPMDPLNALLSFVYTLLMHDARSACESTGLDAAVGFLHRDRPGRPGLALDLMEEFRPFLADRLVLSLINRKQVSAEGFQTLETGGVIMDEATRKTVLVAWQQRKQEELTHPFLEEKMTVGLLPQIQARLLARHLRGDLDGYPPFFWK